MLFELGVRRSEALLSTSFKYTIVYGFNDGRRFLRHAGNVGAMVRFWIEVASALPYTDDLSQEAVITLLGMASDSRISPHIPVVA